MEKTETIEEFYQTKFEWMPECLQKEIGHFNVFRLDDFKDQPVRPAAYSRKGYFKISLIEGRGDLQYADKDIRLDGLSLLFTSSMIPYNWCAQDHHPSGYFCIFTDSFFTNFGNIKEYPVFNPRGNPAYPLTPEQRKAVAAIYERMLVEISSDYIYKYDVLRTLVFEIIHTALRLQPSVPTFFHGSNANTRVSSLFTELLERQFPIETRRQQIRLRNPAAFAEQLSVHVNHLNRALKETTGKTTSSIIAERVTQEARALLRHTDWNISEIAWCLGFEELPHFINFFKKNTATTPKAFRSTIV